MVGRSNPRSLSAEMGEGAHWFWYKLCISIFYIYFFTIALVIPRNPKKGEWRFFKKKGIILMRCGVLVFPNSPSILNTLHEKTSPLKNEMLLSPPLENENDEKFSPKFIFKIHFLLSNCMRTKWKVRGYSRPINPFLWNMIILIILLHD